MPYENPILKQFLPNPVINQLPITLNNPINEQNIKHWALHPKKKYLSWRSNFHRLNTDKGQTSLISLISTHRRVRGNARFNEDRRKPKAESDNVITRSLPETQRLYYIFFFRGVEPPRGKKFNSGKRDRQKTGGKMRGKWRIDIGRASGTNGSWKRVQKLLLAGLSKLFPRREDVGSLKGCETRVTKPVTEFQIDNPSAASCSVKVEREIMYWASRLGQEEGTLIARVSCGYGVRLIYWTLWRNGSAQWDVGIKCTDKWSVYSFDGRGRKD